MSKQEKKALVPVLRFPEFRDDGEWTIKRLSEVADVNASGDLDSENFSPTKTDEHVYPIYSNSVTQEGLYGFCTYPKYPKNSVTVTARGTLGVAFYRDHDFMGIGRLLILSNLKNVDPCFLQENWNYLVKIPLENGGIPQLTAIKARAVELYIPIKEEQQKIADCLASIDELITAQTQKCDALKAHKKGLMQQLFPAEGETLPKLRFPEFRDKGEWEEKRLDQVCEVNPSVERLPESFVYIDLGSVEAGVLLQKKIIQLEGAPSRAQRLLTNGDVIFQMVRPYQKNNYLFKAMDELDYVASTGYAQLRAHQSNMYLFQYINIDGFVNRVLAKCTGSNYPAINSSDLSEITVEIPEPQEQQKIADCLASIDELITAQTHKIDDLKAHKKGLMQQLFPAMDEV